MARNLTYEIMDKRNREKKVTRKEEDVFFALHMADEPPPKAQKISEPIFDRRSSAKPSWPQK